MDSLLLVVWISLISSCAGFWNRSGLPPDRDCGRRGLENQGFSASESKSQSFSSLWNTYRNCTYVDGNLVLTWMTNPDVKYDLSFLHRIKYVKGYVIIAANDYPDVISLPNLEIIRGKNTFKYGGMQLSLLVALNDMRELRLPKLSEISNGGVKIVKNRNLCNVHHIDWNVLMAGRLARNPSLLSVDDLRPLHCPSCSAACTSADGKRLCWSPHKCQIIRVQHVCDAVCPERCYHGGHGGCCDRECAAGCAGPRPQQCYACKNFQLGNRCVRRCPKVNPRTYRIGQRCIVFYAFDES